MKNAHFPFFRFVIESRESHASCFNKGNHDTYQEITELGTERRSFHYTYAPLSFINLSKSSVSLLTFRTSQHEQQMTPVSNTFCCITNVTVYDWIIERRGERSGKRRNEVAGGHSIITIHRFLLSRHGRR
jgi:hypothetical protein